MADELPCYDCLLGATYNIKYITGADICVLSFVRENQITTLAVVGGSENINNNRHFKDHLFRCIKDKNQCDPAASDYLETNILPENLFKSEKVHYHFQIPVRFNSEGTALVSLYFQKFKQLQSDDIGSIAGLIHSFEYPFLAIHNRNTRIEDKCKAGAYNMLGTSLPMVKIFEMINAVSGTDANVLIYGETGTGKELIARAIHNKSWRRKGKFIPVDCVAIPATLIESELFGFEKGAFTGATERKFGLIEFANKGTLFLDEISELDINVQAKLLRVLQERRLRRVGGSESMDVSIRVIAAMNIPPQKAIASGRLRKDLFYRLNVIPIHAPPLRKRREDIPLLINHFLREVAHKNQLKPKKISKQALDLLMEYNWSGNVRQLQNVIERVSVLTTASMIEPEHLPSYIRSFEGSNNPLSNRSYREVKQTYLRKFEKKYLQEIMKQSDYNIEKAAEIAHVSCRTLYRLLKRHRM